MENPIKIDDLGRTIWLLPASLFFETPEWVAGFNPHANINMWAIGDHHPKYGWKWSGFESTSWVHLKVADVIFFPATVSRGGIGGAFFAGAGSSLVDVRLTWSFPWGQVSEAKETTSISRPGRLQTYPRCGSFLHLGISWNGGTPKSSILGYLHLWKISSLVSKLMNLPPSSANSATWASRCTTAAERSGPSMAGGAFLAGVSLVGRGRVLATRQCLESGASRTALCHLSPHLMFNSLFGSMI